MKRKHFWSESEDSVLRERYPDTPSLEIAEHLGLTIRQIYQRARALGLHKSKEFNSSPESGRLMPGSTIGLSGRFLPGLTPWNKGVKGLDIGGKATRFKKGHVPQTWKPIGSERVADGYLQRKLTDTGCTRRDWVPVHHIVWRDAGREIPAGHALAFRDGNRSNFALDNLELISRGELMRRNTIHNYGPEVAHLMQLRGAITRQINKRERKATP
jgi:hypothetical protein